MRNHFNNLIFFTLLASVSEAFVFTFSSQKCLTSYTTSKHSGASLPLCDDNHDHDGFKLKASRRAFLVDNIMTPTVVVATTLGPQIANAAEDSLGLLGTGAGGGDLFKEAQERMVARNAERAAARAAKQEKKSKQSSDDQDGSDDNEFVFKVKVKEMQKGIAERKEQAILLDQQETKRSEESEFIQELRARSIANQEKYKKESMRSDKLSTSQFRSQYDRPRFTGVRRSDGSTQMVSAEELERLEKAGRIQVDYEIGVTRDGEEYKDYSKAYLKLVGEDPAPSSPASIETQEVAVQAQAVTVEEVVTE